jgi:O-antigen/teichoic acid export membrane protein
VLAIVFSFFLAMALVWGCIAVYGYLKIKLFPFYFGSGGYRKELMKFSVPLIFAAVMGLVLTWTDTLMLGRYTSAADVGVYNVATSLVRLLNFVLGSAGFVFMPIAGELFSRSQMQELGRTYQVLTKWVFSATLPLFFILFLFPETIISFLFEERYVVSSDALRILSVGYMFNVFMGLNIMVMMVLGLQKELMWSSVFGAVLNIVLNYLFIKGLGFGIEGAALSTALSFIAINILNSAILYARSRIHPLTTRYLRPILASGAVALVIYVMTKSLPFSPYVMPVYLVLFVVGYVLCVLVTRSIEREDLDLIDDISRRLGLELKLLRGLLERFLHR